MTLAATVQSLEPGALVELFILDLDPIGVAARWCFSPSIAAGDTVTFAGVDYVGADVEVSGYEVNGQGQIPQPTLKVSNATLFLAGAVLTHRDAVGARLTRLRVFARYLDGRPEADPEASFPPDIHIVEQKTKQNKTVIEWRLSAGTDVEGRMLPGRTVVRDYCPWAYRRWSATAAAFDYADVECPWAGSTFFTALGVATTDPTKDVCGRKISDCRARFGTGAVLPFGGFPGVGLNKVGASS